MFRIHRIDYQSELQKIRGGYVDFTDSELDEYIQCIRRELIIALRERTARYERQRPVTAVMDQDRAS